MPAISVSVTLKAPVVIPSVRWGVIIRDYDQFWPPDDKWKNGITHVSRPSRNKANQDILGLPATCRSENTKSVKLTKNLQTFIHQRSCELAGLTFDNTYAKMSFASFTRGNAYAFDFKGSRTNRDYINNTHEDAEDIENKPMWTSGAVSEILGDQIIGGIDCWVTKAINVSTDDIWKYSITDVGLCYYPTTSRREMQLSGAWRENKVIAFSQYNDKVLMWNMSYTGVLYAPKFRVQLLKSLDERPPIYVS